MRSRFQDETPPSRPEPPEDAGKSMKLLAVNIVVTLLVAVGAGLAIYWSLNDVSGEYQGMDPNIGVIKLTLIRKPAAMKGQIFYGRGTPLTISSGDVTNNRDVMLTFELPKEYVDQGMQARTATLSGQIDNGVIKGTLEESGFGVPVTLVRNKISSLYMQLQSHLPW